jgi:hypothetical protein
MSWQTWSFSKMDQFRELWQDLEYCSAEVADLEKDLRDSEEMTAEKEDLLSDLAHWMTVKEAAYQAWLPFRMEISTPRPA